MKFLILFTITMVTVIVFGIVLSEYIILRGGV